MNYLLIIRGNIDLQFNLARIYSNLYAQAYAKTLEFGVCLLSS
jgi:hypothetical protein